MLDSNNARKSATLALHVYLSYRGNTQLRNYYNLSVFRNNFIIEQRTM